MTPDESLYRDHLDRAFAHLERAEPFAERLLAVNPFVARFFALGFAALEDSVFAAEAAGPPPEPVPPSPVGFVDPEDDDPPEEDQTPLLVEEPEHGGEARAGEAVGA